MHRTANANPTWRIRHALPADAARLSAVGAALFRQAYEPTHPEPTLSEYLATAFDAAYAGRRRPLLVVGGPRFDPRMTADLGVDRIFGRGTTPGEVASYLVSTLTAVAA